MRRTAHTKHRYTISKEELIMIANQMINNHLTIRQLESKFGYPKSTIHRRLMHNLKDIDYLLYLAVRRQTRLNLINGRKKSGEILARYMRRKRRVKRSCD